jgi:hypothetical protein
MIGSNVISALLYVTFSCSFKEDSRLSGYSHMVLDPLFRALCEDDRLGRSLAERSERNGTHAEISDAYPVRRVQAEVSSIRRRTATQEFLKKNYSTCLDEERDERIHSDNCEHCCFDGKCGSAEDCDTQKVSAQVLAIAGCGSSFFLMILAGYCFCYRRKKLGAVKVRLHQVLIPATARRGERITVQVPSGGFVEITVPRDARPGSFIMISLPADHFERAQSQPLGSRAVVGRPIGGSAQANFNDAATPGMSMAQTLSPSQYGHDVVEGRPVQASSDVNSGRPPQDAAEHISADASIPTVQRTPMDDTEAGHDMTLRSAGIDDSSIGMSMEGTEGFLDDLPVEAPLSLPPTRLAR